jgi:hypothetical protein
VPPVRRRGLEGCFDVDQRRRLRSWCWDYEPRLDDIGRGTFPNLGHQSLVGLLLNVRRTLTMIRLTTALLTLGVSMTTATTALAQDGCSFYGSCNPEASWCRLLCGSDPQRQNVRSQWAPGYVAATHHRHMYMYAHSSSTRHPTGGPRVATRNLSLAKNRECVDSATKGPLCANSRHRRFYVVGQPQSQKATIKNVSIRPFAIAPN